VGFPLTVIGSIIGKNRAGSFDAPCRTRNIPREIPPAPWYHKQPAQMLMAGFLPFRCDGASTSKIRQHSKQVLKLLLWYVCVWAY